MKFNKSIGFLLFCILIGVLGHLYLNTKENFISSGEFPSSQINTLLYGDYPKSSSNKLSDLNSSQLSTYYPVYDASSNKINNIRYWSNPNNGKCSPAEFCNAFYGDKPVSEHILTPPENQWDDSRVNYYNSNTY